MLVARDERNRPGRVYWRVGTEREHQWLEHALRSGWFGPAVLWCLTFP